MKKWILIFLALLLCLPLTALATIPGEEEFAPENRQLIDKADLLTYEEEVSLRRELQEASEELGAELAVVTMQSLGEYDIDWFLNTLYDEGGYGYGSSRSGVLLLICMQTREYRILSNGYAGVAIGPDQIDTLCDIVQPYLTKGTYATAFTYFANESEDFLAYYLEGSPFNAGKNFRISLVIGIIAGLIVAFILKGQLKSVRKQDSARVYVKKGSMRLTYSRDIFLYRNVTRTKKQERVESTSSGSGGTARSKGGGSF